MDTEQLKMILETVSEASDGAKQFGILWLIKEFLTPISIGIIILLVTRTIVKN